MTREIVFIVNPKGGNGRTLRLWRSKVEPNLDSVLGSAVKTRICLTEYPQHATELARKAVELGADTVVAVGGDGTLTEVVNGFFLSGQPVIPGSSSDGTEGQTTLQDNGAGTQQEAEPADAATGSVPPVSHSPTALALIPLGTGCDFARSLSWKRDDPLSALHRIAERHVRVIDVGRMVFPLVGTDKMFINICDGVASIAHRAHSLKHFGPLCYTVATALTLLLEKNMDLLVQVDGSADWQLLPKVRLLCVGNAKFEGGGFQMCPQADLASGQFQVVVISHVTIFDFALKAFRLLKGTHTDGTLSQVNSFMARTISIKDPRSHTPEGDAPLKYASITAGADGETYGSLPIQVTVIPSSLQLVI